MTPTPEHLARACFLAISETVPVEDGAYNAIEHWLRCERLLVAYFTLALSAPRGRRRRARGEVGAAQMMFDYE